MTAGRTDLQKVLVLHKATNHRRKATPRSPFLLTRMFLPDLGADEHPVDGEEGAEQEGDGERAQHVPVEDVHADEIAYLVGTASTRCHCAQREPLKVGSQVVGMELPVYCHCCPGSWAVCFMDHAAGLNSTETGRSVVATCERPIGSALYLSSKFETFQCRPNFYTDIWPCSIANTLAAIHIRPMDEVTLKC